MGRWARDARVSDAEGDVIGERPLFMQHARDGWELVLMEVLDDYEFVLMSVREKASDLGVRSGLVDGSYVECTRRVSHAEGDVIGESSRFDEFVRGCRERGLVSVCEDVGNGS